MLFPLVSAYRATTGLGVVFVEIMVGVAPTNVEFFLAGETGVK